MFKMLKNNRGEINCEGDVVDPLAINHAVQIELDKLNERINDLEKQVKLIKEGK